MLTVLFKVIETDGMKRQSQDIEVVPSATPYLIGNHFIQPLYTEVALRIKYDKT